MLLYYACSRWCGTDDNCFIDDKYPSIDGSSRQIECMEYASNLERAAEKKEQIAKCFKRLKAKRPKKLDALFHEAHNKAFEDINCLECANCCKTTSPIFRAVDIKRISSKMRISEGEFEDMYLKNDADGDWVLKLAPCPFLQSDNYCSIYDYRPQACREYPHTNRKRMVQILDLTLKNTEICPAAARISVEVTEKFGH